MPELPEVEIVRRGLALHLPGKKIKGAKLFPGHTVRKPAAQRFCADLIGRSFENINRRGKYLLFQIAGGKTLVVHLGMSGRLLLTGDNNKLTHIRMSIGLDGDNDAAVLYLQDPRRFSRVWLADTADTKNNLNAVVPSLMQLGVEPLLKDLTEEYLRLNFLKRKQSIKGVLLDQSIIAGIGNIYADESLFVARIHPLTSAQKLTTDQLTDLIAAIKKVLNRAIERGGSSLRNYSDAMGVNGNYQHKAWVYARNKKPCRICGTLIKKVVVTARSTHFCPCCQQANRSRLYQPFKQQNVF